MAGSVRSLAWSSWCLASLIACGGAEKPAEAPRPEPSATDKSTPPPAPAGDPAAAAAPAATANAPDAPQGWPFGPAQTPEDRAAQLDRLQKDPGPLKSNWVPPGKRERYGHAEGLIDAPPDIVRTRLQNFSKYKELAGPKFKTVRVVDKQGKNTDVYFQLPIMHGLITIHYVTRFPPARPVQGADVIEGTFVNGNIKDMHIAFTVRPGPSEKQSIMVCDLLLLPNVPAPQSAVDEELRDACGDAINNVKKTLAAQTN